MKDSGVSVKRLPGKNMSYSHLQTEVQIGNILVSFETAGFFSTKNIIYECR